MGLVNEVLAPGELDGTVWCKNSASATNAEMAVVVTAPAVGLAV